ncbi:hypothetical protein [Roseiconus lacunae]|uniref:hypothetical protein n=1 Tax=Roseiconus lacunae TaxID=2605694 RepID=UPI001E4EF329|nr:hypothetical protein [Roseiconus lacunae]MCD0459159.1 hypothetical protein [Roseiconus lacunae]
MNPEKPQDGQIRVSIDSGANCQSAHHHYVEAEDLGFDSREEWDDADDEAKMQAVIEYWHGNGYPECYWEYFSS